MSKSQVRVKVSNPNIIILLAILVLSYDWKLNYCNAEINNNTSDYKSSLKCNPRSRHLFGQFIMQCWSNARKEVGLSDPFILKQDSNDEERFNFKMAVQLVVLKIFNYNTGTMIFYKHWQPVPYVRLYNSGEDIITSALYPLSMNSMENGRLSQSTTQLAKSQSQLNLLTSSLKNSPVRNNSINDRPPSFTVVSDPFDKFAAGYQDSIARMHMRSRLRPTINSTMVKNHIVLLLDYEQPLPATYQNLYPMCGAFFDFFVDIVAHRDKIVDDWVLVICEAYPFICKASESLPSSSYYAVKAVVSRGGQKKRMVVLKDRKPHIDRHGALAALRELFVSEPLYLRALCYMLLVDYVCLPMYALPGPCQFLNATRRAAEEALDEGKDIPFVLSDSKK